MNFLDNENFYKGTEDLQEKNKDKGPRLILKTEEKVSPDPLLEDVLEAVDALAKKGLSSFVALETVSGVNASLIQVVPNLIDDEKTYTIETIPSTDEIKLFFIDEVETSEIREIFEFFYKNKMVKNLDLWNERMI